MNPLEWSDHYKTGIPGIDRDHRELFTQIKTFSEATESTKAPESSASLLEFLLNYTQHHFAREEALMQRISYPRFTEHKLAHEQFMTKVSDMFRNFQFASQPNQEQVGEFLSRWWSNHVLTEDFAFIPWHEGLAEPR